jgi:hypothetical protein
MEIEVFTTISYHEVPSQCGNNYHRVKEASASFVMVEALMADLASTLKLA